MPIMIYRLLKDAIKKFRRPVSTEELVKYVHSVIPMCADHVPEHLPVLERYGLVSKKVDFQRKMVVWQIEKDYSEEKIAEMYPELLLESMYYHAVSDELAGKPIPLDYVIELLYEISGGSEKRPAISFVRKALRRIKEMRPELYNKMIKDIEEGKNPRDSEVLRIIKEVIRELK